MHRLRSFAIPVMVQATIKIFSMESIIVTSAEELRHIVKAAVLEVQQESTKKGKAIQSPEVDTLTPQEAVEFLRSIGYPISLNTLRCRVSSKVIPSSKCRGRRVLSKTELSKWVENNTRSSYEAKTRAAEHLAAVAMSRI